MDKAQVADVLDEIGILLEIQGENPFRCRAYYNASRAIRQLETDLGEIVAQDRLTEIEGIGATLKDKITTLATTGRLQFYDDLRAKTPAGLLQIMRLPGLGPKKAKALYDQLKIDDLAKLKGACETDQISGLKGFGKKTRQKILEGLAFLEVTGQRVRIDHAESVAQMLLDGLRKCKGIVRIEACGSLRRRRETINDIDLLVSSDTADRVMDSFVKLPSVVEVIGRGETKVSVLVDRGKGQRMQADLRVVTDAQFPFALHYFTGGKDHNIAIRARAQQYGLKLNEYGLAGPKKRVACRDEAEIFKALELDYIPPELREMTGEIEAAAEHRLPRLIEFSDLQGTFHCHTTWSDGADSIKAMAAGAQKLGLKYLGIADHSKSLTVANGLTPERVREQQAEIDAFNARSKGIRLFKGTECDILPDGSLDFDDKVLASFDYVVASVHAHLKQTKEEMTARIIRAIENPHVTMLGHATGRLLLRREGYKVDLEAVLQAAVKNRTLVEINAHPHRLDIDWVHCKRAKALGVTLVINPDAHSVDELSLLRFGIDVARRGWIEKDNVFNTRSTSDVTKAFQARRPC